MSDVIVAGRSPFEALDGLSMPGLAAAPDRTRHVLRGRADIHSPAAEVLGFALPTDACRAAGAGDRHALWLGPDEWLLLTPAGERLDKALAFAKASRNGAYVTSFSSAVAAAEPDTIPRQAGASSKDTRLCSNILGHAYADSARPRIGIGYRSAHHCAQSCDLET